MANNVKFADWIKVENTTNKNQKFVLLNMKDGLKEIHKRFLKTKELIIIEIKSVFWKNCENQEKKMDIEIQKPIDQGIERRLNAITMLDWLLNLVILKNPIFVKDVKTNVCRMVIIMIIKSLWKLFGFVGNVMAKSIEYVYQRERLNLWTSKGDAIVRTMEETHREESEAVLPPRNWSVSFVGPKVTEWLRHTTGCSFYQGRLELALAKSFLIDLDAYDYAEAA